MCVVSIRFRLVCRSQSVLDGQSSSVPFRCLSLNVATYHCDSERSGETGRGFPTYHSILIAMGAVFTSWTRAAYWKVGLPFAGDDGYRFSALATAPPRYNPVTRLRLALHAPPTPFSLANPLSSYSRAAIDEDIIRRPNTRKSFMESSGYSHFFSQFPLPIFQLHSDRPF